MKYKKRVIRLWKWLNNPFCESILLWKEILLITAIVMLVISYMLPFSYQFKSQYFLIGGMAVLGIYFFLIKFIYPNINDHIRSTVHYLLSLSSFEFYLLSTLVVVPIYTGSWLLSVRIYEKKLFSKGIENLRGTIMKKEAIFGIIFVILFVILLKIFQDSIPRITEPITNTVVLVDFVILAIVVGISQLTRSSD